MQSFRLAVYNLSTLPTEPLLHLAVYAGLASLKLPACYDRHTKNTNCPVCDPNLGELAKEVPYSHHVNSTIVCRLSGKIMDADNMPMAFPNGYVYSKEVGGYCIFLSHTLRYISGFGGDGVKRRRIRNVPSDGRPLPLFRATQGLHFLSCILRHSCTGNILCMCNSIHPIMYNIAPANRIQA